MSLPAISEADKTLIYANDCLRFAMDPEFATEPDALPSLDWEARPPAKVFAALRALNDTAPGGDFARLRAIMAWEYTIPMDALLRLASHPPLADLHFLRALAHRLVGEDPAIISGVEECPGILASYALSSGLPNRWGIIAHAIRMCNPGEMASSDAHSSATPTSTMSRILMDFFVDSTPPQRSELFAFLSTCPRAWHIALLRSVVSFPDVLSSTMMFIAFLDPIAEFTRDEVGDGIQRLANFVHGKTADFSKNDPVAIEGYLEARRDVVEFDIARNVGTDPHHYRRDVFVWKTDRIAQIFASAGIPYVTARRFPQYVTLSVRTADTMDDDLKKACHLARINTRTPNLDVWEVISGGRAIFLKRPPPTP